MSIDEWAKKVAADIALGTDERAPADAAIFAHLGEFEDLARRTRLKIPAFARALTRAGLTLRSGEPYSAATLRAQIHRARTRRKEENRSEDSVKPPRVEQDRPGSSTVLNIPAGPTSSPSMNLTALERMQRSRPKRPTLGQSED
ncbi:MAG: hypothetical protein KIS86_11510 [Devosia sp.]|nr:hypothetical protein [Devosia sp.]